MVPIWLFSGGKAHLKEEIARRVSIEPSLLPYNHEVLSFVRRAHTSGRKIVLATASHMEMVQPIAQYLGMFADVIATNGRRNVTGEWKRRVLEERFGDKNFDYVGNSVDDLPVWRGAQAALVVTESKRLQRRIEAITPIQHVFSRRQGNVFTLLSALRTHQWVKNLLIFVPLIVSHKAAQIPLLASASVAFAAFSLAASGVYIINDLLDLNADRRHPKKRYRPFAAGTLPVSLGVTLIPITTLGALLVALILPRSFIVCLVVYMLLSTLYSFALKKVVVLDVVVLAILYFARVLAGGLAVHVIISPWLAGLSLFLFHSLACVKRHAELGLLSGCHSGITSRGYLKDDRPWVAQIGATSGCISVLVMALYINSNDVRLLYSHPEFLWAICPLLLYWITRLWMIVHRGGIDDDPILLVVKDGCSYAIGAAILITMIIAM